MSMYICSQCKKTCIEPGTRVNMHSSNEIITVCPHCKHDDIVRVDECGMCGKPARALVDNLCPKCCASVRKRFTTYVETPIAPHLDKFEDAELRHFMTLFFEMVEGSGLEAV